MKESNWDICEITWSGKLHWRHQGLRHRGDLVTWSWGSKMHGIYISKTGKRDKTFSESFQKHPALKRKKKSS